MKSLKSDMRLQLSILRRKSLAIFRNICLRFIPFFLILAFVTQSSTLWADTVSVPVHLSYPFLRQLLILTVFDKPANTARILVDSVGCSKIILSDPRLSGHGDSLRLVAKANATIGIESEKSCLTMMEWDGEVEVVACPVLLTGSSPLVGFEVKDSNLYNQQGERLASGIVMDYFKECVHSVFSHFQIDFGPSLDELKALLPVVLPGHSTAKVKKVVDSLHLAGVRAGSDNLTVELSMEVEALSPTSRVAEPLLTTEEMQRWEKQWESWDVFLTFIVKWMADATELAPLRATLLEILLDSRYEFRNALASDTLHETDPVRQLFVRSWKRLVPVLQEISATLPGQETLAIVAFLTAGDALQALEHLGLEITTDGLRRLARLTDERSEFNPLRYVDDADPEMRRLFGFEPVEEEQKDLEPLKLNFFMIRPAFAATSSQQSWARLDKWVPTQAELDQYLPLVRNLLDHNTNFLLKNVNISSQAASIYQKLVLAAAWQESCLRQYIVKNGKVVPLRSDSGDVGLMQVNEHVWRGFYSIHKLQWDIVYNARAGSEILLRYLVDYALPKGEHKQGNVHYLARAGYSAYNGGPSQISRYRNPKAPAKHRKIDDAFWKKYEAVQKDRECRIVECLGRTAVAKTSKAADLDKKVLGKKTQAPKPSSPPKSTKSAGLKQDSWILAQNPKHFTLQIAAFNSEQASKEFILKQPQPERFACYRLKSKGKALYAVIYGIFSKRSDADKAATSHFGKPWVRDFKSIQEIIKKQ